MKKKIKKEKLYKRKPEIYWKSLQAATIKELRAAFTVKEKK